MENLFPNQPEAEEKRSIFNQTETPQTMGGLPVEAPLVSDDVLKTRATRYDLALGTNSEGYESTLSSLRAGRESELRATAQRAEKVALQKRRNSMVKSLLDEAAQSDKPFDKNAAGFITGLSQADFDELDGEPSEERRGIILEEMYADRVMNTLAAQMDDLQAAVEEDVEAALNTVDFSSRILTNQEIAQKNLEEMAAKYKDANPLTKALDFTETLIPGFSWWNLRDGLQTQDDDGSFFTGENLRDQVEYFYSLPPAQAKRELAEAMERRARDNVFDALAFASALVEYTRDERMLDNLFTAFDAADIVATVGVGKAVGAIRRAGKASANASLRAKSKQVIKNNRHATGPGGAASVVESAGDINSSAVLRALESTSASRNIDASTTSRLKAVVGNTASIFNPESFFRGQSRMSAGRASLMMELQKSGLRLFDTLTDVGRVDRLGVGEQAGKESKALQEAMAKTEELMNKEMNANNNVMDVQYVLPSESIDTVGKVSALVGRKGGQPFATPGAAKGAASRYGLLPDSFTVEELPTGGHGIRIDYDVKENGYSTIEALDTDLNNSPVNVTNMALNFFKGSKEVLSDGSNIQRLKATTGTQRIRRIVQESVAEVGKLSKKEHKRVSRAITHNRATVDEDGVKGKFFDTVDQLEDFYNRSFDRLPSDKEILAYFKLRQLSDFDYILRDISIYRDMALAGTRRITTKLKDRTGKEFETGVFNGFQIKSLPKFDSKTTFSIVVNDGKTTKAVQFKDLPARRRTQIERDIKDGKVTATQLYDPMNNSDVFGAVDGIKPNSKVSVVVSTNQKTGPLRLGNLPYKHGGHHDTTQNWYVKQRDFEGGGYRGDKSIFAIDSEKQARKLQAAVNRIRVMLKESPKHRITQEMIDFANDNLPFSAKQARALFYGGRRSFNPNEEFLVTRRGQKTTDVKDFGNYYNELESPHNPAYWTNRQYTQERDLGTVQTVKEEAGTMTTMPVDLVDPITSISRGIQQITEAGLLNDLKYYEGTNFVRQFGHLLNNNGRNPIAAILNPQWKGTSDPKELSAAKSAHAHLINILGQRGPEARWSDAVTTKLENFVYDSPGIGGQIVSKVALATTKDPTVFARKVAFHSKLGLFNPLQLVVQGQGVINIMAFSPQHGPAGAMAAILSRSLSASSGADNITKRFASWAMGQTPGEFEEAHKQMTKRGFDLIENANALIDDVGDEPLFNTTAGKFLDAGRIFFDQAEKFVRVTAWHTAVLEYRRANPGMLLTEGDWAKIANRADDLGVNMLRNSNSRAQSNSLATLPMQFFTYQQRLMELFLGRRVSAQQKMMAFAVYSGMYGVPTAGAAVVGVLPIYEMIKAEGERRGQSIDDNVVHSFLSGGAMKAVLQATTGEKYGFSESYGPGGLLMFKDIVENESFVDIMGGASISIARDVLKNMSPIVWYLDGLANPNTDVAYKITADDWMNLASNISSVNVFRKLISASQTHKYITRSGTSVTDLNTTTDRILHAFRIDKQEVSNTYTRLDIMKKEGEDLKGVQKDISTQLKRAITLVSNQQDNEAHKAFRNVQALVELHGLTSKQFGDIYKNVLKQFRDLDDQISLEFFIKNQKSNASDQRARSDKFIQERSGE